MTDEEAELQPPSWEPWSFCWRFRCEHHKGEISLPYKWNSGYSICFQQDDIKTKTKPRPHSFTHWIGQHWQPSSSQGNRRIKMFTATPHTSVSFLKCFAERVLHKLQTAKGATRKRLRAWGSVWWALSHPGSQNKVIDLRVKHLSTFMRIRPMGNNYKLGSVSEFGRITIFLYLEIQFLKESRLHQIKREFLGFGCSKRNTLKYKTKQNKQVKKTWRTPSTFPGFYQSH